MFVSDIVRVLQILIVYRPPNKTSCTLFFEEFARLLEHVLSESSASPMIAGDLNFHMENSSNALTRQFIEILETFDLKQHVFSATHASGHTLDLLITRLNEELVRNVKIHDPMISDHLAVFCNLSLIKPQFRKKVISTRKLRSLDIDSFREDVRNSSLVHKKNPLTWIVQLLNMIMVFDYRWINTPQLKSLW